MVPTCGLLSLRKRGESRVERVISMAYLQNEGISFRPQEAGKENVGKLVAHFLVSYL